jgi:hypothetical protein
MPRRRLKSVGRQGEIVEFSKDQVLEFMREQGSSDQVSQAEQQLPDQVDTERDAGLLSRFGIDPQDLLTKFGGNLL